MSQIVSAVGLDSLVIAPLEPSSALPARIADIQFSFWGFLTGFQSAAEYERFLRRAVTASRLPAILTAKRGGKFAGSVNLLERETIDCPGLTPWIGQLFVVEEERGHGVGRALVDAAVTRATALGYRRVHLFTSGTLPRFYAARGWKPIDTVEHLGKPRMIMAFDTL